jgi:hypothetical protein
MTKAIPLVALALALGGCGGGERAAVAPDTNTAENAAGENVIDQVMALSDQQRNGVFIRALIDSGIRCDNVSQSERLADVETNPAWRVHCTNGSSHVVTLLKDGTARVYTRPTTG